MAAEGTKIPAFQRPTQTGSVSVNHLLHDGFEEQSGILYHRYQCLSPTDNAEISKSSSCVFIWRDDNAYLVSFY